MNPVAPKPLLSRMLHLSLAMIVVAVAAMMPVRPALAGACAPALPFASISDRIGVNVTLDYGKDVNHYDVASLRAGWYIDYTRRMEPSTPGGMSYVQVLRTTEFDKPNWRAAIGALVDANPGGVWAIGNEMDRTGQDPRVAADYARIYHLAYHFIKGRDPSSTVMVGAIVQPTPIRLLYLDMVLEAYQQRYGTRMPVEYWNTHGFILRESGDWGASRPPGLGHRFDLAMDWDVPDHGNIEIFKQLIYDFRRWMAERGYRDTPLVVSEYGILMPPDYDAGNGKKYDYEFVRDYMLESFRFMAETKDASIGYPHDENRLVQAWAWYSLNDIKYDLATGRGFNGNLFDHDTGVAERLASDFRTFSSAYYVQYTDVVVRDLTISPSEIISASGPVSVTVDVSLINRGNLNAQDLRVQFWLGDPERGGTLLGQSQRLNRLAVRCSEAATLSFVWTPGVLDTGSYPIYVVVTYQNSSREFDPSNNRAAGFVRVGPRSTYNDLFLPAVMK
jgi:hypothetical protein